ncbi:hypothetical protein EZMO1_2706 [Endozoicomonas montiporae CL-33]|uniref:Uncharacterized protein n=1 Tax=Endozoicomonas montiporae CL-33 TaxID=570277 RepID=A0A142BDD7_9GAMM|nr:hypothetical protein EZMO1_2706 [Endozoicomonas montiporae CL-33]
MRWLYKKKEKQLRSEINRAGGLLERVQQVKVTQAKLIDQKGKLRHRFKTQEISQKEYQLQFQKHRKQCDELDMTIKNVQSKFFEKHVPSVQSILEQDQLFHFLTKA